MSGPVPIELQSKIAMWRQRALTNELTEAEMREAVAHLRAGRMAAGVAAAASKKSGGAGKAKVAAPSADSMLGELDGM